MDKDEREVMLRSLATILNPVCVDGCGLVGYEEIIKLVVDIDKRLKALEKEERHMDDIHREHRHVSDNVRPTDAD
jgi:hypothetical protein